MADSLLSKSASFRKASSALTRAATILLTLWISLLAGVPAAGVTTVTHTDFNGHVTTRAYDPLTDRLLAVAADPAHPSLSLDHAPARHEFGYDLLGRRTAAVVKSAAGTVLHSDAWSYDAQSRPLVQTSTTGTLRYAWDATGTLAGVKSDTAGGYDLSYDYDALNRLATVHHGQEGVDPASYPLAAYGYDANGNLAGVSYANQVTHAYAYNTLNRLTGLAVDRQPGGSGAIATPLHGYGYTLNLAGQRTHIAELGGRTIAHTYDALHRLTSETIGHAQGNAAPTPLGSISYDYDENNNRLARNTQPQNTVAGTNLATFLPNQNHFYNERDQLAGHDYDANGNTTSSLQSSVFGSSVSDVYSFDNRLIRRVRGDGVIVDLLYSADGDRVAKWTEQGGLMRSIHRYLVDRLNPTGYAQVLEEKDHAGQLVARHLYGHDLIASDKRGLGGSPGDLVRSFYLYDGLGSVRGLTDNTGVLQETYDYDAYGTLIGFAKRNAAGALEIQNPNNLELITNNRYLFTGEQWDADLGMYFLRARYLNPGTGRFHTEDTYEGRNGEPLTLHKYLYAHANPVMGTDPSGNNTLLVETTMTTRQLLAFSALTLIALDGAANEFRASILALDSLVLLLKAGGEGVRTAGSVIQNWKKKVMPAIRQAMKFAGLAAAQLNFWIKRTFFVVKSAMPHIYAFNVSELSRNPLWHLLTYNGPGSPITKANRSYVVARYGHLRVGAPAGYTLDEFPFASTAQGGRSGPAQARMVPALENSVQGGFLSAFYRFSALKGSKGNFLVVPVPL